MYEREREVLKEMDRKKAMGDTYSGCPSHDGKEELCLFVIDGHGPGH